MKIKKYLNQIIMNNKQLQSILDEIHRGFNSENDSITTQKNRIKTERLQTINNFQRDTIIAISNTLSRCYENSQNKMNKFCFVITCLGALNALLTLTIVAIYFIK